MRHEPRRSPKCPACGRWLDERKLRNSEQTAYLCPRCQGCWFDGGDLESALSVASRGLAAPKDAPEGDRPCPRDGTLMRQFDYPQTLARIDMCPRCRGIWLDARELQEIRVVRSDLARRGKLERDAPPVGIKGWLIQFIDDSFDDLFGGG
ncbi:MAG: zf-TFIIB domain-containing protein [Phycisphaeraceae bacterium]|nr:zf-TFIIB domain-containing protein [Phycisphaeraceae bacterium]